jgi:hypothetical protein
VMLSCSDLSVHVVHIEFGSTSITCCYGISRSLNPVPSLMRASQGGTVFDSFIGVSQDQPSNRLAHLSQLDPTSVD